jgi:hypothetical protein
MKRFILLLAFAARLPRKALIPTAMLFVLAAPIQPLLGSIGANHAPVVGALHVLNGVAIFGLTVRIIAAGGRGRPTSPA